jgi:hypothetical protein
LCVQTQASALPLPQTSQLKQEKEEEEERKAMQYSATCERWCASEHNSRHQAFVFLDCAMFVE